jgi:hypothetical protein
MKAHLVCIVFAIFHLNLVGHSDIKDGRFEPIPAESSWIKSEGGAWLGNFNVWYKIDNKSHSVLVSYNKKKWKDSGTEAVWLDRHGRWMCFYNNKLMYSENGANWKEIFNRTWQDINGTWYRFDSNWDLWEVKI